MGWELKDGSGTLFRKEKESGSNRPDYGGTCMIGGITYELAGWIKEGKSGKFLSLSIKPQEEHRRNRRQENREDVPF